MNLPILIIYTTLFSITSCLGQKTTPPNVKKLMEYYPQVTGYKDNYIFFTDGSKLVYDDGKKKSYQGLLDSADVEDMFREKYKSFDIGKIPKNYNPGRFRNEEFFKKIYGSTESGVNAKITTITWCPKLANQKIRVTTVNNFHLKMEALSNELDKHPEFQQYIKDIAGAYKWRVISGTNRLSTHSFGIAMDINLKYSHYWQWDCKCKDENTVPPYQNLIPLQLVRIFEKHGFIWGGNWYHYDTMHFEYRPELF